MHLLHDGDRLLFVDGRRRATFDLSIAVSSKPIPCRVSSNIRIKARYDPVE
jgi:hypothetical protein